MDLSNLYPPQPAAEVKNGKTILGNPNSIYPLDFYTERYVDTDLLGILPHNLKFLNFSCPHNAKYKDL